MSDLTKPTRGHWGENINYIGKVIVERLKDSRLKYLILIPDDHIIYGFQEEPMSYPNIYVFPVQDAGETPTTSGDIVFSKIVYNILVEGMSPDLTKTDDDLRLLLGDIISELLNDRNLTYTGTSSCSDLYINILDNEYFPPGEEDNIRRWHRMEIVVEVQLDQKTVVP